MSKIRVLLASGSIAAAVLAVACSSANQNAGNANQVNANGGPSGVNPTVAVPANTNNPTTAPVASGPDPTQNVTPAANVHPGPDNSDIDVEMNKAGDVVETRVFKNNPNVSKVVVMTVAKDGKVQKTVTVYDKNGKTHTVPDKQSDTMMQATGDEIAQAAGIIAGKPKAAGTDTKDTTVTKTITVGKTATDQAKDELQKVKPKTP